MIINCFRVFCFRAFRSHLDAILAAAFRQRHADTAELAVLLGQAGAIHPRTAVLVLKDLVAPGLSQRIKLQLKVLVYVETRA